MSFNKGLSGSFKRRKLLLLFNLRPLSVACCDVFLVKRGGKGGKCEGFCPLAIG